MKCTCRITSAPAGIFAIFTKKLTRFESTCSLHHIGTAAVRNLILETIQETSRRVASDEAEFIRQVLESSEIRQEETAKVYRKKLVKAQKQVLELNSLIRKLYEDNVKPASEHVASHSYGCAKSFHFLPKVRV